MLTVEQAEGEVSDLHEIVLTRPILGFEEATRFSLIRLDEVGILSHLQSLEDPELKFLVVPATTFFPDYTPVVDDEIAAEIDAVGSSDIVVMLIVRAGDDLESTTVNLRGPVLINTVTQRAAQAVLEDPELSTETPLITAS